MTTDNREWVTSPRIATPEMHAAFWDALPDGVHTPDWLNIGFTAMLNVAPPPPTTGDGGLREAIRSLAAEYQIHADSPDFTTDQRGAYRGAALRLRRILATPASAPPAAKGEAGARCYDCDRKYGDEHGFPDLVVPNDVWLKIGPAGHEGGLLCPSCICKRAHDAGIERASATFTSGPFCVAPPEPGSVAEDAVWPDEATFQRAMDGWNAHQQRCRITTIEGSLRAALTAAGTKPAEGATDLHPATLDLMRRFSVALIDKAAAAEKKYGYSDGWMQPDWMDECRAKLVEHIGKGDPRDVAIYSAFLWHHGERTALPEGGRVGGEAVYRCDYCGASYTDTRYCCQRRREYLNDHGHSEATTPPAVRVNPEAVAWQFQGRDGQWCWFHNEEHRKNTIADGSWPIRALGVIEPVGEKGNQL